MTIAAYRSLESARKGHARGAPAYSIYVNRKLGRALAAVKWFREMGELGAVR